VARRGYELEHDLIEAGLSEAAGWRVGLWGLWLCRVVQGSDVDALNRLVEAGDADGGRRAAIDERRLGAVMAYLALSRGGAPR
jgi:hypothetical protein